VSSDSLFRLLTYAELKDCYSVYFEAFEWLKAKKIPQWFVPISPHVFEDSQKKGELYGLFIDDVLAGIACLNAGTPKKWADEVKLPHTLWINHLAVGNAFHGQKLGKRMVERLKAYAREATVPFLHLDCVDVDGVLPTYYEKLGFRVITAKDNMTHDISPDRFRMSLMVAQL